MKKWEDFDKIVQSAMDEEEYQKHLIVAKISADIIRLRLERGWTQKELAERANLKQSAIARIESGTLNDIGSLFKILNTLEHRIIFDPMSENLVKIEKIT